LEKDRLSALPLRSWTWTHGLLCAGITGIDACKRDPAASRAVNVEGTIRVIDELVALGVRPVFFSSDYVFSGNKGGYVEEDRVDPITAYGRQKVEVESHLGEACAAALVIRLSKVFGVDASAEGMLAEWWRALERGETIRCAGDQWFCPTFVADVVNGVVRLLQKGAAGVYHLCQPERYTREQLLRGFAKHAGIDGYTLDVRRTEDFGFLDCRGRDVSMSPDKFVRETGCRFTPMRDCFRMFLEARRGKCPSTA